MDEEKEMKKKGVEINAMQAGKRIEAIVSDALLAEVPKPMICLALEFEKTRLLTGNVSVNIPTEHVELYNRIAHQVDGWKSQGKSTWPMIVVIAALMAEIQPTYADLKKNFFIKKLGGKKG